MKIKKLRKFMPVILLIVSLGFVCRIGLDLNGRLYDENINNTIYS